MNAFDNSNYLTIYIQLILKFVFFYAFTVLTSDGGYTIDSKHDYYHQIQGQLHVMGRDSCDLIVWTLADMVVINIVKDNTWLPNIATLINFYFNTFISWIMS